MITDGLVDNVCKNRSQLFVFELNSRVVTLPCGLQVTTVVKTDYCQQRCPKMPYNSIRNNLRAAKLCLVGLG